jgi:acetyl-CoA carboxylase alpha subunit
LDRQLRRCLEALLDKSGAELRDQRYSRFRNLGAIESISE